MRGRTILLFSALVVGILVAALLAYAHLFGPAGTDTAITQFVVSPNESVGEIASRLQSEGLVKSSFAFGIAYAGALGAREARAGGYELSPSMDAWTLARTLANSPYLAWVTLPPGLRQEELADLLATTLSWTGSEKEAWALADASSSVPGAYIPNVYLIPSDESPAAVEARLSNQFLDTFAPYADEAAKQGLSWQKLLTFASLIEREAAGPDMKLIAGILWNRLDKHMNLQVDATLQYIKGTEGNWWPVVHGADKYLDSPYNTYEHAGLPPTYIAEPSLAAIQAVLAPATTSCLYYLHDYNGEIHCSPTYAGHLANVNKYLK